MRLDVIFAIQPFSNVNLAFAISSDFVKTFTPDASILFILDLNGKIIYCSDYFCKNSNIDKNDIISKHVRIFNNELVFDSISEEIERYRKTAIKEEFDFIVNSKPIPYNWYFIPVFNSDENLAGTILLVADKKQSRSLTVNVFKMDNGQKPVSVIEPEITSPFWKKIKTGFNKLNNLFSSG